MSRPGSTCSLNGVPWPGIGRRPLERLLRGPRRCRNPDPDLGFQRRWRRYRQIKMMAPFLWAYDPKKGPMGVVTCPGVRRRSFAFGASPVDRFRRLVVPPLRLVRVVPPRALYERLLRSHPRCDGCPGGCFPRPRQVRRFGHRGGQLRRPSAHLLLRGGHFQPCIGRSNEALG